MALHCAPMCGGCAASREYGILGQTHFGVSESQHDECWEGLENAFGPGDVNKMFQKLTSDAFTSKYKVDVLSSPKSDGPWVITMDGVISNDEADRLIELGTIMGYQRSVTAESQKQDGTSIQAKGTQCPRFSI